MREICTNAANFAATPRGQNMHPLSGVSNDVYGYDFNTGDREWGVPASRQFWRRAASCPPAWKTTHPCPEPNQQLPMRHDGPWYTTLTEPLSQVGNLLNRYDPITGLPLQYSNIRYSCDEFPPATWVEGGSGAVMNSPSNTRCAGISCATDGQNNVPVKAEQNWRTGQGHSHARLRDQLQAAAEATSNQEFREDQSIIHFHFVPTDNGPDGIAATVYTMLDIGNADQLEDEDEITQAKRSTGANSTRASKSLTIAELKGLVKAGKGFDSPVYANLTYILEFHSVSSEDGPDFENLQVSESSLTGKTMPMPRMEQPYRWDLEDSMEEEEARRALNTTLARSLPEDIVPEPRSVLESAVTPLLKRATAKDLQAAREVVKKALSETSRLNKARVAEPLRNKYGLKPGTIVGGGSVPDSAAPTDQGIPPLLVITDEIAAAAALVAEADAMNGWRNVTRRAPAASKGTYWMQDLARKGTVPWGNDPNYVIFRNVLDYGAVGDGITPRLFTYAGADQYIVGEQDDTKAINKAMGTNSTRCGKGCNGSTTKNAIVYFPPGNYLVSSTIALPFGTQVIGDANNRPTLVAAPSFVGLGVLSTDEYTGAKGKGIDGGDPEYYVNTANFYRQIRNLVIDIRKISQGKLVTCLHYQVAQATSLQNVELIAAAGSSQIGMFAENGSGGSISDVTFTGGGIGLKGGSQQFTAQRLKFNGCTVGVQVIWDWGWVWKSITMNNVKTGFQLVGDNGVGNIGSVSILDSSFTNVGTAIVVNPISATPGSISTGIALENIAMSGVSVAVADTTGATLLASTALIDAWAVGPVYEGAANARTFSKGGKIGNYRRHSTLLDAQGNYFERAKPQYEDQAVSAFVHTKDLGCTGDGSTDDTAAFQAALYASLGKILFVDAGSYILTSTITVPPGAKIVGETWSQLVASGSYFSDASKPKVLVKVGNAGQVGNIEMQDLIFTNRGPTAGLVLIEWNIQAASPGSAGLWDCHVRVGGATGTELTPAECPPVTSGINSACSAASLMMHLTTSASGYFENMWLWGADHMIDDPDLVDENNTMVQTSIYIARGFLIESTKPTWLYGTASEHAVFYQYNFHSAANIYAGMIQSESPYFQPTPPPPAPFTSVVGIFPGDPNYSCTAGDEFSGCDESWAVIMTGSENIFVSSAGLYSWFSTYAQTCIDTQLCQKALVLLKNNHANIRFQNLVTIGAKYMAVMDGKGIPAADNLNVKVHPDWSQISIFDVSSNGTNNFMDYVWVDPAIWDMEQPQFTCSPPCNVKLPPWKGATSTVNYPLITVSQGTWTSTITQAPLTITEWVFDVVTLKQGGGNNKRDAAAFWPIPATTPYWPAVVYIGGVDGRRTTTSATVPFPTPPASMGPDAPAPPSGSWPKRAVQPVFGSSDGPVTKECGFLSFNDPACVQQPWFWGNITNNKPDGDDDDIENFWDLLVVCPNVRQSSSSTSTSTSTTSTSTTKPTSPAPSPYEQGDPLSNKVQCFGKGETTEDVRMQSAAHSFCNDIEKDIMGPGYSRSIDFPFPYNGGVGTVTITISFAIKDKCSFIFNRNLCEHYLSVPADSCNCKGVNGKQGGVFENNCYSILVDPNLTI
ncbi:uncharacterized protein E0L32_004318 [Thyridium curvatum]|uniref:Rhamnogalacturonase A/B/Epimerase-like pectate lyase domain-containing protein n=1 Tax=Thyridium curvatum TaxID=1093900 RepID=A0A507BGE6_9PEZI|nr:uncharacterized protein E0L32_004318 [Thyridium curvatum]TPX15620.1 hypothetical protein E0L32_004318 [Thyridium curvatum]